MTDILFMDIDGPMIPQRAYYLSRKVEGVVTIFDPVATGHINLLLDARPELKLVISSTWRYRGYAECVALLKKNGINPNRLHEDWQTPNTKCGTRSGEIRAWLDAHPEIRKYVALDDERLEPGLNQALCSAEDGMSFTAVKQLHMHLGYDAFDPSKDDDDAEYAQNQIDQYLRFSLIRHDFHNPRLRELANEIYPPAATKGRLILL